MKKAHSAQLAKSQKDMATKLKAIEDIHGGHIADKDEAIKARDAIYWANLKALEAKHAAAVAELQRKQASALDDTNKVHLDQTIILQQLH
jgi:hypothetical protein